MLRIRIDRTDTVAFIHFLIRQLSSWNNHWPRNFLLEKGDLIWSPSWVAECGSGNVGASGQNPSAAPIRVGQLKAVRHNGSRWFMLQVLDLVRSQHGIADLWSGHICSCWSDPSRLTDLPLQNKRATLVSLFIFDKKGEAKLFATSWNSVISVFDKIVNKTWC